LRGDVALEPGVAPAVDLAHAASAKNRQHFVRAGEPAQFGVYQGNQLPESRVVSSAPRLEQTRHRER
jgi:hypothetical protein